LPRGQLVERLAGLLDEAPHHSRDLADLDVLEAQLAREALTFRLRLDRDELSAGEARQDLLLLEGRVAAKLVVERRQGFPRGVRHVRVRRAEEAPEEIVQAIRAAGRGEAPFSPRASGALLQRRSESRPGDTLTPRERQVLELVGQGLANKQISRKLGIREKTVKAHLTSVFQRIGVSDRTAAALWASRNLP
jgi:DNA-binding CsgD family transcriptional regulator